VGSRGVVFGLKLVLANGLVSSTNIMILFFNLSIARGEHCHHGSGGAADELFILRCAVVFEFTLGARNCLAECAVPDVIPSTVCLGIEV
jgi:hypothetical protein